MLLNDVHGDIRVGLTGNGISVLVVVQNQFLDLKVPPGRPSWSGIARARWCKRSGSDIFFDSLEVM